MPSIRRPRVERESNLSRRQQQGTRGGASEPFRATWPANLDRVSSCLPHRVRRPSSLTFRRPLVARKFLERGRTHRVPPFIGRFLSIAPGVSFPAAIVYVFWRRRRFRYAAKFANRRDSSEDSEEEREFSFFFSDSDEIVRNWSFEIVKMFFFFDEKLIINYHRINFLQDSGETVII